MVEPCKPSSKRAGTCMLVELAQGTRGFWFPGPEYMEAEIGRSCHAFLRSHGVSWEDQQPLAHFIS